MSGTQRSFWHVLAILTTFIGLIGYHLASAGLNGERASLVVVSIVFTFFGLAQAGYALGWKRALTFFGVAVVLSWISESHSIATANVGAYYYTNVLGPKIGQVPAVIPLSWFMILYPAYVMANLILLGKPVAERTTIAQAIWASCLAGVIQTGWDLSLDPYMVGVVKAWIWVDGGPYFGIPWANYYGWVIVVTGISLVYRLIERHIEYKPAGELKLWIAATPLAIFAINFIPDLFIGEPVETRLIATFAMGISLIVATDKLLRFHKGKKNPPDLLAEAQVTKAQASKTQEVAA